MMYRFRARSRGRVSQLPTPPRQPPPLTPLENINPQLASPLFNGHIPRELADAIFSFVITEDNAALPADDQGVSGGSAEASRALEERRKEIEYPANTHYTRPGYSHKKVLSLSILRTCKLAYLYLHHLPPVRKEHVFWHHRSPNGLQSLSEESTYFNRFHPDTLARITSLHLFAQQFWLEYSFQKAITVAPLQGVQRLVLTIRRGDWWNWEKNAELGLGGDGNGETLYIGTQRPSRGGKVRWERPLWAWSFAQLPALREFVLELETAVYKKAELEEMVDHVVLWGIPMGTPMGLFSKRSTVEVEQWRGPPCLWADLCAACGSPGAAPDCEACEEKKGLLQEGKGPMIVMMRLKFEPAPWDGSVGVYEGSDKERIES